MTEHAPRKLDHPALIQVVKNTPLVAIDLVIRNARDEVLLGLRTNEPAKGFWFVPGGRICKNERIHDAFERIANDELGTRLSIEDARFLGVFEHLYKENFADEPDIGTHYVVLAYEVKPDRLLQELPRSQHSQYRWQAANALLRADDVHPNTKAYLARRDIPDGPA
ncbi:MAG: GDP-mannose mannosyl hydrolase [Candidatus Eisenbacteria sp.]|nr:GDP-mannose mannosyl hydrolase [Candidatus Eisenbacteria bacterium]